MSEEQKAEAGWYDFAGGKRFFDGNEWTDHYAYVPPKARTTPVIDVMVGTIAGGLVVFVLILLIANAAPNDVFFPVKFLVDPDNVPSLSDFR